MKGIVLLIFATLPFLSLRAEGDFNRGDYRVHLKSRVNISKAQICLKDIGSLRNADEKIKKMWSETCIRSLPDRPLVWQRDEAEVYIWKAGFFPAAVSGGPVRIDPQWKKVSHKELAVAFSSTRGSDSYLLPDSAGLKWPATQKYNLRIIHGSRPRLELTAPASDGSVALRRTVKLTEKKEEKSVSRYNKYNKRRKMNKSRQTVYTASLNGIYISIPARLLSQPDEEGRVRVYSAKTRKTYYGILNSDGTVSAITEGGSGL